MIVIWLFFALPLALFAQGNDENKDALKDNVLITLPYSLDFVRDHINLQFDSESRAFFPDYNSLIYALPGDAVNIHDLSPQAYKKFTNFPLVRSNKFYVFYGNYKNMQHVLQDITPYSVMGLSNPALEQYANLPADARQNDIYLWSPDTPYWYSEYTENGKALPFRSYFILHLNAVDNSHTEVEAIEYNPVVNAGRKLSIDEHGAIHHFDIHDAPPSTHDREYLLYCINQFIERRIPDRHVFNCLSEDELVELKRKQVEQEEMQKEWQHK